MTHEILTQARGLLIEASSRLSDSNARIRATQPAVGGEGSSLAGDDPAIGPPLFSVPGKPQLLGVADRITAWLLDSLAATAPCLPGLSAQWRLQRLESSSSQSPAFEPDDVAELLERMGAGDSVASEALYSLVYRELHNVAHRLMRSERGNHTLQTTALVNEAWLKLKPAVTTGETKGQFMGLAARAMRRVLIDHARKRGRKKRTAEGERLSLLDDVLARWDGDPTELLALDAALDRLDEHDQTLRKLVELRFFGGFTLEEAGQVLGMSVRQVHRRWIFARGWLHRELSKGADV